MFCSDTQDDKGGRGEEGGSAAGGLRSKRGRKPKPRRKQESESEDESSEVRIFLFSMFIFIFSYYIYFTQRRLLTRV